MFETVEVMVGVLHALFSIVFVVKAECAMIEFLVIKLIVLQIALPQLLLAFILWQTCLASDTVQLVHIIISA